MSGMADPGVAMRGGLRRRFVERIVEPAVVLAEERSGRVVRCYALAGSIVRVTFAGAPLAERLGRAFAHALLPDHQGSVDLDVHVWDSASNGLPPPAHMLPETEADGLVAADEPGLLAGFVSKEDTLNLIDFERAQAYFWLSSLEAVPGWVTAAPLRRILQWFFAPRDVHLMHGAAVGRRERALLITARGGSGKSTTALGGGGGGGARWRPPPPGSAISPTTMSPCATVRRPRHIASSTRRSSPMRASRCCRTMAASSASAMSANASNR